MLSTLTVAKAILLYHSELASFNNSDTSRDLRDQGLLHQTCRLAFPSNRLDAAHMRLVVSALSSSVVDLDLVLSFHRANSQPGPLQPLLLQHLKIAAESGYGFHLRVAGLPCPEEGLTAFPNVPRFERAITGSSL
jgi:hypothetical protein